MDPLLSPGEIAKFKRDGYFIKRGLLDPSKDDPFELFVSSTQIRWCFYRDTHKILGTAGAAPTTKIKRLGPAVTTSATITSSVTYGENTL